MTGRMSSSGANDIQPPTHDGPCVESLDGDGEPLGYCVTCYQPTGREATRQPWEPRPDGTHPEREIWAEAMGREATEWEACCDHCGCKPDQREGHDDTCRHGCNDVSPPARKATPINEETS